MGGPAFHFRWSPRSLSGPQGPRERGGGRGLRAGSGRGGAAAAAGPLPRVSPGRPGWPGGARGTARGRTRGRARCLLVVWLPLPSV